MIDPEGTTRLKNEGAQLQVSECEAKLREVLDELDKCGEATSAAYVSHAIDALKRE